MSFFNAIPITPLLQTPALPTQSQWIEIVQMFLPEQCECSGAEQNEGTREGPEWKQSRRQDKAGSIIHQMKFVDLQHCDDRSSQARCRERVQHDEAPLPGKVQDRSEQQTGVHSGNENDE
jgi:hypothetical protein